METIRELYIIGAGGFGREVAETVRAINAAADVPASTWHIAGFIDDDEALRGKEINDLRVVGNVDDLKSISKSRLSAGDDAPYAVIAIAKPEYKISIAQKLAEAARWATIIHPTAIISSFAHIGNGSIIQPNVFVSTDAVLSEHCILNACTTIGHDTVLEDYVSVMSHCDITGCCTIRRGAYIATSVAVTPGVTVGESAFLGAACMVSSDVPEKAFMLGNPARQIR